MADYDTRIADVPLSHIPAMKEALRIVPEPDGAERAAAIARLEARLRRGR